MAKKYIKEREHFWILGVHHYNHDFISESTPSDRKNAFELNELLFKFKKINITDSYHEKCTPTKKNSLTENGIAK